MPTVTPCPRVSGPHARERAASSNVQRRHDESEVVVVRNPTLPKLTSQGHGSADSPRDPDLSALEQDRAYRHAAGRDPALSCLAFRRLSNASLRRAVGPRRPAERGPARRRGRAQDLLERRPARPDAWFRYRPPSVFRRDLEQLLPSPRSPEHPELYPLSVGLVSWNELASAGGGAQPLYPLVITGALVSVKPIMFTFLFLQRFWQGGLTFGSLKD